MALTMHRTSEPLFKQILASLLTILQKAEEFCAEKGLDPGEFLGRRLAPDMFTLTQHGRRRGQIGRRPKAGCRQNNAC